ncbi:non-ribosomal peptide synthetase [Posidoniimonas polymericola]|nr:non-ribosomal peptide synthetase [Posidoniimonas polymericola]
MQESILFTWMLDPRAGFDLEQIVISGLPEMDAELLGKAFTHVVRTHAGLSATFDADGSVSYHRDATVTVETASGDLPEFLREDRTRGFKLTNSPLMRATLLTDRTSTAFVWTVHHILVDGRSFAPVLNEAFDAYDTLLAGQYLPPPPFKNAHANYLQWLCETRGRSVEYFCEYLRGKTCPTPLPCSEPATRPLPVGGSTSSSVRLSPEATARFNALAERLDLAASSLVQAALAILLQRLAGDRDVVFGQVLSNRAPANAIDEVGLYINTLPLRLTVDEEDLFSDVAYRARLATMKQRQHGAVRLADIKTACGLQHSLFETLLMYETQDLSHSLRCLNSRWDATEISLHEQPTVPLSFVVVNDPRGGQLEIRTIALNSRFEPEVAEQMATYLATALESIVDAEKVKEVRVLPDHVRDRIVYDFNETSHDFTEDALIQQLFEQQAAARPESIAVECDGRSLSYRQLEKKANQVANSLRSRGVRPRQFVGLCMRRDLNLVVAMLGILKSGAAYVPIEPTYPQERIDFILEDAQAATVLTEEALEVKFQDRDFVTIEAACDDSVSHQRPAAGVSADDACYCIFTSGSTGKPKGVLLSHKAVVNTLEWVNRTMQVGPSDRLLFVTSPCFDLSVYDVFGVLGAGATVVVASEQTLDSPHAIVESLVNSQITIWDSAPAALQRLVPLFPADSRDLRLVMLSGDYIPLTLPDDVREAFPNAQVMSLGGATEAAIWSNYFPVGEVDPRWTSIPYGFPIQNTRYYVLGQDLSPCPYHAPGDLYIAGECLANGYLNRPELTEQRFIDDPFVPGEKMYMTGDLARFNEDGCMEFLGRSDFQVKIRGYRIELGEVESAISSAPGVEQAVCIAHTDAGGQKALAAYVVGPGCDADEIKRRLADFLPDYMTPSHVVMLDAMPVTSNGKIDRMALLSTTDERSEDRVAPATQLENDLVQIWERLLRREVGVTDNFFDLGGQSLLAVSLVVAIEKELGHCVPLGAVMQAPTVRGIAGLITGEASDNPHRHLVAIETGSGIPIVLVPGIGGYGFTFERVAHLLGDHPVYVFNSVGTHKDDELVDSVEEVVEAYLPQLLAEIPDGPVVLGGYSFGVLVAQELGIRLERMGRRVPVLISFDGQAPGHPKTKPAYKRAIEHAKQLRPLPWNKRYNYVRDKIQAHFDDDDSYGLFDLPGVADEKLNQRLRETAIVLWRARERYRPTHKLNSPVLLVKAAIPFDWIGTDFETYYGWRQFVSQEVSVHHVPGQHLEMFQPDNSSLIAETVLEAINRAAGNQIND